MRPLFPSLYFLLLSLLPGTGAASNPMAEVLVPAPWQGSPAAIDWPQWHQSIEGLTDISTWYSHVKTGRIHDDRRHKGAFMVGNGRSFAMSGLSSPLNTFFNHGGPTYQQPGNFFGEQSLSLLVGGESIPFIEEWAYRFRGTGVVGSTGITASGLALHSVDIAPLGAGEAPIILRFVVAANNGEFPIDDATIQASLFYDEAEIPTHEGSFLVQQRGSRRLFLGALPTSEGSVSQGGNGLAIHLGSLQPGEERRVGVALIYQDGADLELAEATLAGLDATAQGLLSTTLSAWTDRLAQGASLKTETPRLDDLYEGMIVAILSQQSFDGAISPMNRYTKTWLRDTIGPLRLFARTGRLADATAMLDYLHGAAIYQGAISNSYALALPIESATPLPEPEAFWETAPLMSGRHAVEAPSYLPLQTLFLYQFTGDKTWLEARYFYLKRAMEGQSIDDMGLMTFSGDETFRVPLAVALSLPRDPTEAAWSANSSFAYVAGMEALSMIAEELGYLGDSQVFWEEANTRRRQTESLYRLPGGSYGPVIFFKDDSLHPLPFEDVATKPLFFGYADASSAQTLQDVDAMVGILMREDGILLTQDGAFGKMENLGYTGMVPGLFLNNVVQVDHAARDLAFDALALTASPSGMWHEIHWKDHSAAVVSYGPSGRGLSEVSARYRPWEGGENIDSLVDYLTGAAVNVPKNHLKLAPHLPPWLNSMSFENLPLGLSGHYTLKTERVLPAGSSPGIWRVEIQPEGGNAMALELRLVEESAVWESLTLNGEPVLDIQQHETYPGQNRLVVPVPELISGQDFVIEAAYR